MLKKIGKVFLYLLVLLIFLFVGLYFVYNKSLPEGKEGEEAQQLVQKIKTAINQTAWDSTTYVEWTFRGAHDFIWDKKRNFVQVVFGANRVLLNANNKTGLVYENDVLTDNSDFIQTAYTFFINDAFWLNAPAQLWADNMRYQAVDLPSGDKGLLATYLTGGVTPGDSYLWILGENGLPKAWQMWVSIIPIGGLEFSWENWMTLSSGAKVATRHDGGLLSIPITNVKSYQTWQEGGYSNDIFKDLEQALVK